MKLIGLAILIPWCLMAQGFASNDSTKAELAQLLFEKAQHTRTQNPDSAIQLLQQSYSHFIELSDTSSAIQSLKLWADINGHLGNYRASYEKLWKALILADEANMQEERVLLYIHLGRYYSFFKRKEDAFHYLGMSLDITKELVADGTQPTTELVKNYYSLCATYRELYDPALAQKYLDSCFLYFVPGKRGVQLPKLQLEQAFLLKESQQYQEALDLFYEIIPWYETHRPANLVLPLTYMGDTYKAMKNYQESESRYKKALAISEQYNSHLDFTPLVHEKLANLYVSMEEFSLAYQSLEKAKELDAKIFDSRSENNRPLLEIQDEFRQEQEKREKLLQQQRIAQLEHEDQVLFLQRTILIVSLILLITIGFVYFNYVRSKLRAEKLEHEKVKEINQIKLRFFTNISHEFKTPLTLILGPLQKLIAQNPLEEGVRESLQMIERNAIQLKHLINQIIEFRKVESTQVRLNAAFGDMVSFCRELTDSFKILAEEKQISLSFTSFQEEIELWFDRDKLEKILNNLISNAIKYNSERGEVHVSIAKVERNISPQIAEPLRSGYVELVVEDSGHGIAKDQQERIFERFYQINTGNSDVQIGSGIGLALTKELVAVHQGDISLQSVEGQGSRFCIRLPLAKQYLSADQQDLVEKPFEKLTDVLEVPESSTSVLEASLGAIEPAADLTEAPVILLVEDHPDMLGFIKEIFAKHYRLLEATNGRDGLEMAISEVPDLIISDVMMPFMDGTELCEQLKSHEVTNHIPVVLLTARSAIEHRILGLETGADAYISKPFHTKHLEVRVQKLLEQRETLRAKYEQGNIKLDSQKFGIQEAEKRFLEKTEQIIEQNLSNQEFTVVHLHKELGFSRMQLYRKLKSLTGLSANEYVRAYKIKKAAVYLRESHLNITEVLYEVGFTNRSYFSKCFKQMYGMSPREYLNEHKAQHI